MEEVLAKGVNFIYCKDFMKSEYGAEMWEKVLSSLSSDAQMVWKDVLLPINYYPFSVFKEMITAVSETLGKEKETELARIYEYIADNSLNKLYKVFFQFTNPSFVIRNYPKLWKQFFNTGNVEVPISEKGHALLKFTLPEIFLDWLPPACLGYSSKAVSMAGGRNLRMQEISKKHLSDNAWEIVYELYWFE
jgi:hypothetical protein